jgi:hypothetical protein
MNQEASRLELGRRLLAALLSYHYRVGMDYALKQYIPEVIDPAWGELGWQLLCAVNSQVDALLHPEKLD